MATFFGEIIQRESRAYWDDLEDCDMEGFGVEVEMLDKDSLDFSYEMLIVTDGVLASKFAQQLMVDSSIKKIALFYETLTANCKKSPSTLYKLGNGALLLTTHDKLDMKLANSLLVKVIPWLQKCSDVVVFTSIHISKFKNRNRNNLSPPLIRCLATSSFKKNRFAPQLEVPNYIFGFAASVISLCQVLKKSAILYVCYTDCSFLDSATAAPFVKLVNDLGIKELLKLQDSSLTALHDDYLSSNLYM